MRYVLMVAFLASFQLSFAQFSNTRFLLSGTGSLSNEKYKTEKGGNHYTRVNYSFSPSVGIPLSENLLIGPALGLGYYHHKAGVYQYQSRRLNIGLNLRKYWNLADNVYLSLNLSPGVRFDNESTVLLENLGDPYEPDWSYPYVSYSAYLSPGFMIKLTDNFLLESGIGSMGFVTGKRKGRDDESDGWQARFGTISLGLSYSINN